MNNAAANSEKLSASQKRFLALAKELELEIHSYSGRGMFGKQCPAVYIDDLSDFPEYAQFSSDQLGKGAVVYCR